MKKLLTLALLFLALPATAQNKPIWSKAATPIAECGVQVRAGQRFKSPDSSITAELRCHPTVRDVDPEPYLHFIFPKGRTQDIDLQSADVSDGYRRPQELLWAPDSKAFLVNGSENAYSGFFVDVYRIVDGRVLKVDVAHHIQHDMVATFLPCKADGLDENQCRRIERNPEFNVSGLAWVDDSLAIVVFAEVPCSSSYGGIMCQVRGYKLNASDGRIIQTLSANELKRDWQDSMAWKMNIPSPPKYKSPNKKLEVSDVVSANPDAPRK
ncbi:MAG TPA: hypothetical protein VG897_03570 [Terriglobales bacterium]|nr:hypothetical protein [Terriglobales bacterium]